MPVAQLAKRFQVSSTLAKHIKKVETELMTNRKYAALRKYLSGRYNRLAEVGEYLENRALETTLIYIAARGSDYLYTGRTGALLSEEISKAGGNITINDLRNYNALIRNSIITESLGYTYHGAPPPSSGGLTIASIIKYMEGFGIPIAGQGGLYFHHLIEAFKHTFALRMGLGDPDFINISTVQDAMLDQV